MGIFNGAVNTKGEETKEQANRGSREFVEAYFFFQKREELRHIPTLGLSI